MTSYPTQTRFVARACEALGFVFTDLDDGEGYLFAISDGTREIMCGAGAICTYPLNTAAAFGISRDKHHTNRILKRAGLATIDGELYFLDSRMEKFRRPGRERVDAIAAFSRRKAAAFCKPNQGSHGDFAEMIRDLKAFENYLARVEQHYDAILVQPVMEGDEYRIFCLDGGAVFALRKKVFTLTGDGATSLRGLLTASNEALVWKGISAVDEAAALDAIADHHGLDADDIPARGETFALPGRRNLTAGGEIEHFTTDVPARLADTALRAASAVGLRVAGVDVFDMSASRDLSGLVVIEVNGNPGLAGLETIGRGDIIDRIWRDVLTRALAELRA